MTFYDDISFENEEQEIKYLKELKQNFDILNFFNKEVNPNDKYYGKYSGVIVITPEQMITIYPVFLHSAAIEFLYYLLYDACDERIFSKTNNIVIKLVNGRYKGCCKLFNIYSFPDKINNYQQLKMKALLDELKDYEQSIKFDDEGSLACFKEIYDDACEKLANAKVEAELPSVIRDGCIIDDDKKLLMKAVG